MRVYIMDKKMKTNTSDRFMMALKTYCQDCPNLDLVETKFGPITVWVDQNIQTGKMMVIHSEFINSWDSSIERYLYSELKCAAIDLFCRDEPEKSNDPAYYPTDDDIHSRLVKLITKYLPWIEDIDAYIIAKDKEETESEQ